MYVHRVCVCVCVCLIAPGPAIQTRPQCSAAVAERTPDHQIHPTRPERRRRTGPRGPRAASRGAASFCGSRCRRAGPEERREGETGSGARA